MSAAPIGEIATADRPDLQRRWIEAYRRAEVELWEQGLYELHTLVPAQRQRQVESLLAMADPRFKAGTDSGLVEQQHWFKKAHGPLTSA